MQRCVFWLFLFLFISPFASSDTFSVTLSDALPRAVKQNIHAYLGTLPSNENERTAFVFSATKNTKDALKALGYYRAKVSTSVSEQAVGEQNNTHGELVIDVVLNEPTSIKKLDVVIKGEANNDSAFTDLVRTIAIKEGDKLNHGEYEKIKSDLVSLALERGYFDNKFTQSVIAIPKNLQTADIIIEFNSGPRYRFGDVAFNFEDINADVLTALTPFRADDFYQQHLLQNLQHELDLTEYFNSVIVRPDLDKSKNAAIPIDVSLTKAKSHQIDLGLGYATDTKENISIGWKTPLVNRLGHRQETKLSYSTINPTGYFIYSIPLSHANNDVLQLKALVEEDDFADLTSKFMIFQVGRVYLKDQMLRQPYIRHLTEKWTVDGITSDVRYVIPGMTWTDKSWQGSALNPTDGFQEYYNAEGSFEALDSQTSFLRLNAQWKYIRSFADKHRFVSRAELGYIVAKDEVGEGLSPSLRFYAGGDQSIRGFAYQSIGPEVTLSEPGESSETIVTGGTNLIVGSLEYQYYFTENWRGAWFTDAGSVNNINELNLVYSVGTGIHYISPVGAIRLELGYPISEEDPSLRIHFTIGTEL
ncbi:autotransporter assembly complex family protein [Colwellia sp. E2M01]|uniref:autotransporter assembly complex protein TamA n=1 Tax=Colwellia sp. E2M01 TaxID=2841561 RepID=UPI001C09FC5D|nr:autotransporter assembly complex family protein [Colwellia sp. E2M01]MBU2871916.1 autotransporter assembly complex protein TamA [Colwellia sp. E2M01]